MNGLSILIKQINYLIKHDVKYNSYEFLCFYDNMDTYLKDTYGKDSNFYKEFKQIKFASNLYEDDDNTVLNVEACLNGLLKAKELLKSTDK